MKAPVIISLHLRILVAGLLTFAGSGNLTAQSLYDVVPSPVNTVYADEVAAVPFAGSLFYCSNRNQNVLISRTDENGEYLFQWYSVPVAGNDWGRPQLLQKNFDKTAHLGPGTLSADGNTLYLTRNEKDVDGIFSATKRHDRWEQLRPFTYNSANYQTAHPSLSRDGNRLFFASNMPGGEGGFDIWYCERTRSGWGKPQNAGKEVNSPANELYPFIRADSTLFFASAGHKSLGGLDIFSANERGGKWTDVRQLPEPVNSTADDFAYCCGDEFGTGYLSSNRTGKTVDIFTFQRMAPRFADCEEQEEEPYSYMFNFKVSAEDTTTSFAYRWEISDGTRLTGDTIYHTFPSVGRYTVTLFVTDMLTGETNKEADYEVDVTDPEQPYITAPETAKVGVPVKLDAGKSNLPAISIESYYWTLSDGTQLRGITTEHSFAKPGEYGIQLGIVGKNRKTGEEVELCVSRVLVVTK